MRPDKLQYARSFMMDRVEAQTYPAMRIDLRLVRFLEYVYLFCLNYIEH